MRWTHTTAAIAMAIVGVASFALGRLSARPARDACPELEAVDAELAEMSEEALELRLKARAATPPPMVAQQLGAIRASADAAGPLRRSCVLRSSLAKAITMADQMKRSTPALWGLDRESQDLARIFRKEPLVSTWSEAERGDVLAQLDETISRVSGRGADEVEHWRRRYYGLLIACEAKDEVLAKLGVTRPTDCPRLAPRRADP